LSNKTLALIGVIILAIVAIIIFQEQSIELVTNTINSLIEMFGN